MEQAELSNQPTCKHGLRPTRLPLATNGSAMELSGRVQPRE